MMIRDHTPLDLPPHVAQGHPPAPNPLYVTALAEQWYREAQENGLDNPKVLPDLPYRASDASTRCDRALHYKLNDVEQSNPPTIADQWRFHAGKVIHADVQAALPRIAPNMRAEVEVDLRSIGIEGSGHCDGATMICLACSKREEIPTLPNGQPDYARMLLVDEIGDESDGDGHHFNYACERCDVDTDWLQAGQWNPDVERAEHILELKTINGMGFKRTAHTFRGTPPEGPKYGHVLQGALAGAVLGADKVCVGYLSLENMGADFKNLTPIQRFAAEWWFDMPDLMPMVERERVRIERLLRFRGAHAPCPDCGGLGVIHPASFPDGDSPCPRCGGSAFIDVLPARELHDPAYPAGAVIIDPDPPRGRAPWRVEIAGQVTNMGDAWECGWCSFRDRCVADGAS